MANYTPNYQLHQWAPEDKFLRTDFNEDLNKIDTALGDSAAKTAALEAAVNKRGNCQIYHSSYVGTGTGKTMLTFPGKPILVNIMGDNMWLVGMQGVGVAISKNAGSGGGYQYAVWQGNGVSFESNTGDQTAQCNNKGDSYQVICFLIAGQA